MNKMPSNSKESNTKKSNFSLFGVENASPTFQKIMSKYRSNRRSTIEKEYNILSIVEKARYRFENLETEDDYLMKELRKDRKFIRKLIFLYGQKAGKHYNEMKNNDEFKAKVDKNYFFTPKEMHKIKKGNDRNKSEKNFIPLLPNCFHDKKKSLDKFFRTKTIIDKEKQTSNNSKNSTRMLGFYNTTSNIKSNSNNIRKMNINKKNISELSKLNLNLENEYLNINRTPDDMRDKIIIHELKKNSLFKNKTNKEFYLSRKLYMDNLTQINKDFTKTKNEFRKHFITNDYGCNFSKIQYEYLNKKYFKY